MRVALVFPGQGSQRPGWGQPWADRDTALPELSAAAGVDLTALLTAADADTLRRTDRAQLSTCAASLVVLAALRAAADRGAPGAAGLLGGVVATAGHSLGELTAAAAAGWWSAADVTAVVAARGAAMLDATRNPPGAMSTCLGADATAVADTCATARAAGSLVWLAADNAPGHAVVSGAAPDVAALTPALTAAGVRRVVPLPVGGAFHTPLMAPAAALLGAALDRHPLRSPVGLRAARAPVGRPALLSAVDGAVVTDPAGVRQRLLTGLTAPVRWRPLLLALTDPGGLAVDTVVEVGPGGVLAGLARRTCPTTRVLTLGTPDDLTTLETPEWQEATA